MLTKEQLTERAVAALSGSSGLPLREMRRDATVSRILAALERVQRETADMSQRRNPVDNAKVLQRLDAMDARCAAATPGPWVYSEMPHLSGDAYFWGEVGPYPGDPVCEVERDVNANYVNDGEFMSRARTDLPAATKLLRALLARESTGHMHDCICVTCDDATRALAEFPSLPDAPSRIMK